MPVTIGHTIRLYEILSLLARVAWARSTGP
jgi:hypothetical protein